MQKTIMQYTYANVDSTVDCMYQEQKCMGLICVTSSPLLVFVFCLCIYSITVPNRLTYTEHSQLFVAYGYKGCQLAKRHCAEFGIFIIEQSSSRRLLGFVLFDLLLEDRDILCFPITA